MDYESVILADDPGALIELCGISTLERLLRTLQRCKIARATILSSTPKVIAKRLAQPSWARAQLELMIRERPDGLLTLEQIINVWPAPAHLLLVIRGDTVFDIRLLQLLSGQSRPTALIDSGGPPLTEALVASAPNTSRGKLCGAALLQHDWALARKGAFNDTVRSGLEQGTIAPLDVADEPPYYPPLRRKLRPFWFPAPLSTHKKAAERVLLNSGQKGTLDLPAVIHGPIENFLISYLCKTSITPHQLTVLWSLAALATTILFATGHLGWGVIFALIAGIGDGLDGKQARVKIETTKRGKLEHRLDSFFEVAWPTALAYHFYISGELPGAFRYLVILLLAEALDGIGKAGIYSASEKFMEEPGRFDRMVRLVGGRQNIYVWVLIVGLVLGVPAKAFIVIVWWEVLTAAVDIPHAAWALYRLRRKKYQCAG